VRQRLGHVDGGGVAGAAAEVGAGVTTGQSAYVNNAAPAGVFHIRHGLARHAQVADDLLREVGDDLVFVDGFDATGRATNAGRAVDHDVDAAQSVGRELHERLDRLRVRGVDADADDLGAGGARNLIGGLIQRLLGAGAEYDAAALRRELACDC